MYCVRKRFYTLQHVLKALKTQRIFRDISAENMQHTKKQYDLTLLEIDSCVKKIQSRTLHHMYKPNGSMFWLNYYKL